MKNLLWPVQEYELQLYVTSMFTMKLYVNDRLWGRRGILPCSKELFQFLPLVFRQDGCALIVKRVQSPVMWTETERWRGRKNNNTEKDNLLLHNADTISWEDTTY